MEKSVEIISYALTGIHHSNYLLMVNMPINLSVCAHYLDIEISIKTKTFEIFIF